MIEQSDPWPVILELAEMAKQGEISEEEYDQAVSHLEAGTLSDEPV